MYAGSSWHNLILEGGPYDTVALEQEVVDAAKELKQSSPNIKAIILESVRTWI